MSTPEQQPIDEMERWWGADDPANYGAIIEKEEGPELSFLTGQAGTGKSWCINRRMEENSRYGLLCGTTGISAVNIGGTTIHSALGFYNLDSLIENYAAGYITRKMRRIADEGWERIIIDEVSMLHRRALDIIVQALKEVNDGERRQLGLLLTGDYLQLPPIPETNRVTGKKESTPWAFEADSWPIFDAHTERLTKVWRQTNPEFLEAINHIRAGRGEEGARLLKQSGVEFANAPDISFQGTTIVSKNDEVDRYNFAAQQGVHGEKHTVKSERRGKLAGEWKNIPDQLNLKIGDYVMILNNDSQGGRFSYVNGDCGWVEEFKGAEFVIRLKRNDALVSIGPLKRYVEQKEEPDERQKRKCEELKLTPYLRDTTPRVSRERDKIWRWVLGEITYYPLRLAYAISVHKSQGLSLDAAQINITNNFFGQPAMAYVSLSRCRTLEGLRIVGTPELLAKRVCMDEKVRRWA